MDDSLITPAERRRLRVRDSILEAAERVFAQEGEAGLSIRRIADEIDYSPAAIYKYFESKDELVSELKEAFFGRILVSVHTIIGEETSFPVRARRCVSGYVRTALEKPHHYVAAFAGQVPESSVLRDPCEFAGSNRSKAFAILTGMVEEGLRDGYFRADLDTFDTAKFVWAAAHGIAMMITHFGEFPNIVNMPSVRSQDEFVDFYSDLVVRSLEITPAASTGKGKA